MRGGEGMKKEDNRRAVGIKKCAVIGVVLSMIIGSSINVQGEVYEYYSLDTTSRELTKQIMNSVTGELEVIPYEENWMKEEILSNIFNEMQVEKIIRADKPVAFYAEIVDLWENPNGCCIQVDGLDSNDINHKYEFIFSIDEETFLSGWDETTEIDDFEIGDLIYIMYDGHVMEIYPCIIDNLYSVTLLDNGNESIRKRIENDDIINIDIIDENTFDLKASNITDTYAPLADMKIVCEEYYSSDNLEAVEIETVEESYMVEFSEGFEIMVGYPTFSEEYNLGKNDDIVKSDVMTIEFSLTNPTDEIFEDFCFKLSLNEETKDYMKSHIKYFDSEEWIGKFDLCPAGKDNLNDGMRTATGITHRYRVDFEDGFMEKFNDVVKEMNVVLKWKGGTQEYTIPVKRESFTPEINDQNELEPDKNRRKLIVVKNYDGYLLVSDISNARILFEISKYEDCEPGDVIEAYGSLEVMEIFPGQMDIDGYDIIENSKASMDVIDCALRYRNFI